MNINKYPSISTLHLFLLLGGIFIFSFTVFSRFSLASSPFDIQFPVSELGNCANEKECRAYCDEPANIKACMAFARKHALVPPEVAERADKFADVIAAGGPGGCRNPRDCETYCSGVSNFEECAHFAEEHGLKSPVELEEARRVAQAVKSGAKLPGGCRTKEACQSYCEDPERAEECLSFAEAAGFIPPVERDKARRMMELMRRGEGPGGCSSPAVCQRYCEDPNNFEKCVAFGEREGMIPPEEAKKIRELGGKGPGGCQGPAECARYCNAPAHQEECFSFAKEHGLIKQEEIQHIQEGVGRLRVGLEHMPQEASSCIEQALGKDILEKIESGLLLPGPQLGEAMRGCLERYRPKIQTQVRNLFEGAPLEVRACLEENLGSEVIERMKRGGPPTPELADKMRFCFERFRPSEEGAPPQPVAAGLFEHAPDEVRACLKQTVGEEVIEHLRAGEPPSGEVGEKMRACFENYRPSLPPRVFEQIPSDIKACLEAKLGSGALERLLQGEHPSPEIFEKKQECFEQYQPTYKPYEASFRQQTSFPPQFPQGSFPQGFVPNKGVPQDLIVCLRERFGEEFARAWQEGRVRPEEFQDKVRACLPQNFVPQTPPAGFPEITPQGFTPPPAAFQPPTTTFPQPPTQVCIQVITPARDPASGACREFPTPCDVPAGWQRVDSCQSPSNPSSVLPFDVFLANIISAFRSFVQIR